MPKYSKYKALIFDLDGTLVDSIPIYKKAFFYMILNVNRNITAEKFCEIYNKNIDLAEIIKTLKIDIDEQTMRNIRDKYYINLLKSEIKWFPDAISLLNDIPNKIPKAICTSSWMKYIEAIKNKLPISDYFKTIVTCDDSLPRKKPDPYGLLLAAKHIGVDPNKCLYIGDQLFDVETAHNANMDGFLIKRPIYTPNNVHRNTNAILTSLEELKKYI